MLLLFIIFFGGIRLPYIIINMRSNYTHHTYHPMQPSHQTALIFDGPSCNVSLWTFVKVLVDFMFVLLICIDG